jgi:hypothetical protein
VFSNKWRVKLVVLLEPVRCQVESSHENWSEEDPEPCSSSLANFLSKVGESNRTVLVGGSLSDVGEGIDGGLTTHTGTGEVSFNSAHSIKSEVGDVGGISQQLVLRV